ncbi:hypothetical protein, partial [Pantoea septica]|uniref:hypothetical protein n=1 Tax=Pantoea septica TaxID=472695 RepID=UPI0028A2DBF5
DLRVMSPTSYQAAPSRVRGCALYRLELMMQPLFSAKRQIKDCLLIIFSIWLIIAQPRARKGQADFNLSDALLSSRGEH